MSWLSQATGVHISPHGAHLSRPDPIGAAKTALTNPLFDAGLALAIPGVGSTIGGALSHIPGAQSVASILGSGGGEAAAGSAIPDAAMGIPSASAAGSGGIAGLAGEAGHWLTGNGGKNALGVAQGVNAILDQKKSENYAKDALGAVEGSYAQRAPLRAQGVQQLLQSQAGNPYAGRAS